ncbi:MAG: FHA domain-containing protein [Bdellovibrionales bacterium]|nr:FHA domain-containing protein [Bdellovibrionales bacterium]
MNDSTEVYRPQFHFNSMARTFAVTKNITIGRSSQDIALNDPKLSSTHCQLIIKGIKLLVKDLGSTNGTFLNGEKIEANQEVEVKIGDRLRFGSHEYVISDLPTVIKQSGATSAPLSIKNLYGAKNGWLVGYGVWGALMLVFSVALASQELKPLPESLSFINSAYSQSRIEFLIYGVVLILTGLFFHLYVSQNYLQRSIILKILLFLVVLPGQILGTTLLSNMTLWDFENYSTGRQVLIKNKQKTSGDHVEKFLKYKQNAQEKVSREEAKLIEKDAMAIMDTVRPPK